MAAIKELANRRQGQMTDVRLAKTQGTGGHLHRVEVPANFASGLLLSLCGMFVVPFGRGVPEAATQRPRCARCFKET